METVTLQLTGIAHGGEAIGRHEGKIVFVPYAIPGEEVTVEIVEEKARWARARLLEVLQASTDRIEPPCPYFGPGQCGGCQWQHIAYERQLSLKREIVEDQLQRLGRIAHPPVADPIALADDDGLLDLGYRNHAQFVALEEGRLGFVREPGYRGAHSGQVAGRGRTHAQASDAIAVDECLLLHPLLDEIHQALLTGERDGAGEETEEPDVPGAQATATAIRRVILRAGINTGQRLLTFETNNEQAPAFIVEDLPVRCVLRRRPGALQPLVGDPWIEEIVAGRTFRVSAESFFQVNTVGAEVLVALAAEMLAPAGHEVLLDGYCGVGLFALSLARQVGQVIGVEDSEIACEDFAWNAGDLDNVALFEGPVDAVLASFDGSEGIRLALIDPPRSGAGPAVIDHLARLGVSRLVYVSCDPATLARDARLLLEAGYRLQQVQPVDLFPQTYHIESIALFTRER